MKRLSELDIVQLFREGDRETLRIAAVTVIATCVASAIFALLLANMDHLAMMRGGKIVCSRTDNQFLLQIILLLFVFLFTLLFAIGYSVQYANWRRYARQKQAAARDMLSSARPIGISCCASALAGISLALIIVRC